MGNAFYSECEDCQEPPLKNTHERLRSTNNIHCTSPAVICQEPEAQESTELAAHQFRHYFPGLPATDAMLETTLSDLDINLNDILWYPDELQQILQEPTLTFLNGGELSSLDEDLAKQPEYPL